MLLAVVMLLDVVIWWSAVSELGAGELRWEAC